MSPRKKPSLSDALEDLKHLPRVLKALEVLNGEQEKVRALMGKTPPTAEPPPRNLWERFERESARQRALEGFEEPTEEQRARGNFGGVASMEWRWYDKGGRLVSAPVDGRPIPDPGASMAARMEEARIILDTPERREYEEAKKAGTVVKDDPFKNATEAQRERMAEQKALLALERARLRPAPPTSAAPAPTNELVPDAREESVDESASGSAGMEVET
jgi:hypothetical protein